VPAYGRCPRPPRRSGACPGPDLQVGALGAAWPFHEFGEHVLGFPKAWRPITDEGVAVGGAFDSDTATGVMPAAQRVAGVLTSWRS
jgi:hypothetical protein